MTVLELFNAWQEWYPDTYVRLYTAGFDYIGSYMWGGLLLKKYAECKVVSFGFKDGFRYNPIILSIEV